ncbi:jouberin-like [Amphiura filiformis]|uniref:jouberin-like n=1 Tax=Amphiura filiformis TaxID=82378 RepID=UPI003B21E224
MESKGKVKKKKKIAKGSEEEVRPLSPHEEHDAMHEKTKAKFDELLMTLQQGAAEDTGKGGKKKKKKKRAQTAESVLQTLKEGADLRKDTDDAAILNNTYDGSDSPRFDKNTTNERRRKLPPKKGVENQGYLQDEAGVVDIPPEDEERPKKGKKKKIKKMDGDTTMTISELDDTVMKPKKKKKKRKPTQEEMEMEEMQEDLKEEVEEERMDEEMETQSAIKPKGKKKKKRKETKDATDGGEAEIEGEEEEEDKEPPPPPEDDGRLLGITIHRTDRLKSDLFIAHPLVRVHLIDAETGTYVKKSVSDRAVTSYYEIKNDKVDYIMPVLTQPFDFKKRKSMIPSWEEQLLYNESYLYLTRKQESYPQIIMFFELLDFVSMSHANTKAIKAERQGGWHRIAWAFLRVTGSNGALNTEKKVRLQLFYPPFAFKAKPNQLDVFQWWLSHPRQAYPSTMYVTIKPVNPPQNVEPSFRSQFANQEEQGKMTYKELHSTINWGRTDRREKKAAPTNWSRLPGQMCRIPNKQLHQLAGDKKGCYVLKFSHNGRSLACGCKDRDGYPVIVYDIPSGRLKCQFPGHYSLFYDICWSPTDSEILTASSDGTARIWDIETPDSSASRVFPHPAFVYAARYHPQADHLVVTGGYDHVIRVWSKNTNRQNGELLQELSGHHGFINSLCFTKDGLNMYSADSQGAVIVWKTNISSSAATSGSNQEWRIVQVHQEKELEGTVINCIRIHPSGRRLLIHGRDNHLRMMELRLHTIMQRYVGALNFKEQIRSGMTGCGSFVFSGSEDYQAYVWNADTGDLVATYQDLGYKHPVCDVDYHPYDHMVAFCSRGEGQPVLIYTYDSKVAQLELVMRQQFVSSQDANATVNQTSSAKSLATLIATKRTLTDEMQSTNVERMERVKAKLSSVMAFTNPVQTTPQTPQRNQRNTLTPGGYTLTPGGTTPMQPTMSTWGSTFDSTRFMTQQFQTPTKPPSGAGIPSLSQAERPGMSPFLQSTLKQTPQKGLGGTMGGATGWTSKPFYPRGAMPNISLNTSIAGSATFTFNAAPTKEKAEDYLQVLALYDYTAQRSDELNLRAGDVIYVLHQDNENWWMGQLQDGQQGYFPANYITNPNEEEKPRVAVEPEYVDEGTGFDDIDFATPRTKAKRKSKKKTMTAIVTKAGEYKVISATDDSEADTPASKGTKKKKKKPLGQQLAIDLANNTDGDTPRSQTRSRTRTASSSARKLAPTFDQMDDDEDGDTPRSQTRSHRARSSSGSRKLAPTFGVADNDEGTPLQPSKKKRSKSQDSREMIVDSGNDDTPRQRTRKKKTPSAERHLEDVVSQDDNTPRRGRTKRSGSRENLLSAEDGSDREVVVEKKGGKRKQKSHHVERVV